MELCIRELIEQDLDRGFFETLSNLADVGNIINNNNLAKRIFNELMEKKNHIIMVAEEKKEHQIIGTATLIIEQKFIHNGGKIGHIEDVAVRKGFEGKGIGKGIIIKLISLAKEDGCYKVILDCDERITKFYEKIGFKKKSIMMRYDL